MNKKTILIIASVACALVFTVGTVFVVTWEIPRPTQQVEKVIPDERFPR